VVDYDGPPEPPLRLGPLKLQLLGAYPGSLGNYAGLQKKIPVVTIELARSGAMPAPAEVAQMWEDLVAWLRRNVPRRPDTNLLTAIHADPS
jgi:hypothetical protein